MKHHCEDAETHGLQEERKGEEEVSHVHAMPIAHLTLHLPCLILGRLILNLMRQTNRF